MVGLKAFTTTRQLLLLSLLSLFFFLMLSVCPCALFVFSKAWREHWILWDCCELLCGCWESNLGSLKEQPKLITKEPSFQPPLSFFKICVSTVCECLNMCVPYAYSIQRDSKVRAFMLVSDHVQKVFDGVRQGDNQIKYSTLGSCSWSLKFKLMLVIQTLKVQSSKILQRTCVYFYSCAPR